MIRLVVVAGLLVALLLGGCSGDSSDSSNAEPSPGPNVPVPSSGASLIVAAGPHGAASLNAPRLFYFCPDGRTFGLYIRPVYPGQPPENDGIFTDGTNGRLFNLTRASTGSPRTYSDGTLTVELSGQSGRVIVSGSEYMSDCELRWHDYDCNGDGSFILETRAPDRSETIFRDGTNMKFFTLYEVPGSNQQVYGDGVVRVDLTAGTVVVDGQVYFDGCRLYDRAF